ncbi:MAG: CsbD family protein [Chloroflexi bacterium]|nr:CsbD family protein [Chloroflexota bacterium]
MSDFNTEKGKGMAEDLTGKAREGLGKLTGDEEMQGKGQAEQVKGNARQTGAEFGQAMDEAGDKVKGFVHGLAGDKKSD